MSWVGSAAAKTLAAEKCLKVEFDVAPAHDALDGAFVKLAGQREDVRGHGPELAVLRFYSAQLARWFFDAHP